MPFDYVRAKYRGKSVEHSERIFPVLVYLATVRQQEITYKSLGEIVGIHWRSLGRPLWYVWQELERLREAWREEIPLIPFLVCNQHTGLPGQGGLTGLLGDLLGDEAAKADTRSKRRDAAEIYWNRTYGYPRWWDVLHHFGLEPYVPPNAELEKNLRRLSARRGQDTEESLGHLRLKHYISGNPRAIRVPEAAAPGKIEHIFPSRDRADVVFHHGPRLIAVEVKARDAGEDEITRGIFQSIKYKALAEALSVAEARPRDVRSILALEGSLPQSLNDLRDLFGIEVHERLRVPTTFRLPPGAKPEVETGAD